MSYGPSTGALSTGALNVYLGYEDDPSSPGLVSGNYLFGALRRRKNWIVIGMLLGLMASLAVIVFVPRSYTAKAAILLAHDLQTDPNRALITDLALFHSRTVAVDTLQELGLSNQITPEKFLKKVVIDPNSSDLVAVQLSANSESEAVRQLNVYCQTYLKVRNQQVNAPIQYQIESTRARSKQLRAQIAELDKQIAALAATPSATNRLNNLVQQKANLAGVADSLDSTAADQTQRATAIVQGSQVVDPPSIVPTNQIIRTPLVLFSGLVVGTAAAIGLVLVMALGTTRLRRRDDIAAALNTSVTASLPSLTRGNGLNPFTRAKQTKAGQDARARFAVAVEDALVGDPNGRQLVVACLDNVDQGVAGMLSAHAFLSSRGLTVHLVDLSDGESLAREGKRRTPAVEVWQPVGPAVLANGPEDLFTGDLFQTVSFHPSPGDVVLVLADIAPDSSARHLRSFARRALVMVTAGRSTAARVQGVGDVIRAAGMSLRGAVVVNADVDDESTGLLVAMNAPEIADGGHSQSAKGALRPSLPPAPVLAGGPRAGDPVAAAKGTTRNGGSSANPGFHDPALAPAVPADPRSVAAASNPAEQQAPRTVVPASSGPTTGSNRYRLSTIWPGSRNNDQSQSPAKENSPSLPNPAKAGDPWTGLDGVSDSAQSAPRSNEPRSGSGSGQ